MIFRKFNQADKSQPKSRGLFSFSRPWPWAYLLNGPNAAASIAPVLIRYWIMPRRGVRPRCRRPGRGTFVQAVISSDNAPSCPVADSLMPRTLHTARRKKRNHSSPMKKSFNTQRNLTKFSTLLSMDIIADVTCLFSGFYTNFRKL